VIYTRVAVGGFGMFARAATQQEHRERGLRKWRRRREFRRFPRALLIEFRSRSSVGEFRATC
jgi:hypothetical protein